MKKAIVTAIFDGYDDLNPAPNFNDWDFFLFADKKPEDSKGWKVVIINPAQNPRMNNRYVKCLLHNLLPDYELYCYVDGNIKFKKEPPERPFWFKHPIRRKVFDEGKAVIELNKENREKVRQLFSMYKSLNFRDDQGLFMNGMFCRRNEETTNRIHEKWWELTKQFETRDQLTLPFICAVNGFTPEGLSDGNLSSTLFSIVGHRKNPGEAKKSAKEVNVIHITPGRSDKNIGRAINYIVERMEDEDWICLRDIDTLPVNHRDFFKQCEEIAGSGDFDLVGCFTNRLGLSYQLHEGKLSDVSDIQKHVKIAKARTLKHGSNVKRLNKPIAGFFMLFSRKIWKEAGGFREGGISFENGWFFDYFFSQAVAKAGGRIGIAEGVYLFHLYRWESSNPTQSTGHLF